MSGSLEQLVFLVVDDNFHMCRIVESILRGFGVRNVSTATTVEAATKKFGSSHFDFAIVDYLMEPEDGLEFTQKVRSQNDSRNPYLPVIMICCLTS